MEISNYKQQIMKFKSNNKKYVENYRGMCKALKKFNSEFKEVHWSSSQYDSYIDKQSKVCNKFDIGKNRRHSHVAYSLMKGRKYKEIENKVKEGNEISLIGVQVEVNEFFSNVILKWNEDKTDIIIEVINE